MLKHRPIRDGDHRLRLLDGKRPQPGPVTTSHDNSLQKNTFPNKKIRACARIFFLNKFRMTMIFLLKRIDGSFTPGLRIETPSEPLKFCLF
jgi:hypothetical protein